MPKKFTVIVFLFFAAASCSVSKHNSDSIKTPAKNKLYIFLMAGQSNMAGRAKIEAEDTITDNRVLSINKQMQWVPAKEPIHFYETGANLDCGFSFGKTLVSKIDNHISVAIIPCAVGGSSIEQWLCDSTHRGVRLYTNFLEKARHASKYGEIKGILWHQGETNATAARYSSYQEKLIQLFTTMRQDLNDSTLPIITGEIGAFLTRKPYSDSINQAIKSLPRALSNIGVIQTSDFAHKGDTLHFNSEAQRLMGIRFAQKYLELTK